MTFDIELATLSDEEVYRLQERYPKLILDSHRFCPTCDKRMLYLWQGKEHSCSCKKQLALHKHYLAAGIGLLFQRLDWDDYAGSPDLLSGLVTYLENHERYLSRGIGLFLSGPFGTGKTMVANLVLKEFVKVGYSCWSTTFANTISMFTDGWNSVEDKRYFRSKFVDSQVLLLDDVGRELRTRNNLAESTFDSILRTRVQEGRPTFLTTNLTLDELETGYGAAVLSLLKENSLYYELAGEDFRSRSNRRTLDEIAAGETRPIF